MMKKLLALLIAAVMLHSCTVYRDVEVKEVLDVQILEFNQDGADCEIYLSVMNPNGYDIKLTEAHIELKFEGKPLGNVEVIENTVIPKHAQSTIKLKCVASADNIKAIVSDFLTLLFKAEYQIEGTGYIKGKAMLVSKNVPVSFKETVTKKDLGL